MEIINDHSKVRNEISQTFEKSNKESYSTQSKVRQNALIQESFLNKQ